MTLNELYRRDVSEAEESLFEALRLKDEHEKALKEHEQHRAFLKRRLDALKIALARTDLP